MKLRGTWVAHCLYMRWKKSVENRPSRSRFFEASQDAFPSPARRDPPWSFPPRSLCQQPICQKRFSRTCRLKGRALGPIACKNYPARTHPWGNKGGEKFHELVYSGNNGQDPLCTKKVARALTERPYSRTTPAVGAVYERPGFSCAKPPESDSRGICSWQ
jgi:hypothetical protein